VTAIARLRLMQLGCIASFLPCMGLIYWRHNPAEVPLGTRHWAAIVGAVWSASAGFTIQRRMARGATFSIGQVTPFTLESGAHHSPLDSHELGLLGGGAE
jgi:hypothetical protein